MSDQNPQNAFLTEPEQRQGAFSFKRVFLVLLLILWSLSVFLLGIYFGEKSGVEPYIKAQINRDIERIKTKEPHPAVTDSGRTVSGSPISFQKTLDEKCGKIISEDSRSFIRLEDLPVRIDTSVLETETNPFLCLWGTPGKNYALGNHFAVYDANSEELGHGGADYFGFAGTEVPGKNGVRLGVRLATGDGGPTSPDYTGIVMRGVRSIWLRGGEQIFVSADEKVISGGDPRLTEILRKYSKPISQEMLEAWGGSPGDLTVSDFDGAIRAVAVEFFGDSLNIKSPEREKVSHLLEILGAVSSR